MLHHDHDGALKIDVLFSDTCCMLRQKYHDHAKMWTGPVNRISHTYLFLTMHMLRLNRRRGKALLSISYYAVLHGTSNATSPLFSLLQRVRSSPGCTTHGVCEKYYQSLCRHLIPSVRIFGIERAWFGAQRQADVGNALADCVLKVDGEESFRANMEHNWALHPYVRPVIPQRGGSHIFVMVHYLATCPSDVCHLVWKRQVWANPMGVAFTCHVWSLCRPYCANSPYSRYIWKSFVSWSHEYRIHTNGS
jgi:hypothetical protein